MSFQRLFSKAIRHPDRAAAAALHHLLAPIGHQNYRRFIVLSRSRTGSNMLVSMLDSHPKIYAKGEILSRLNGRSHHQILSTVFGRQPFYIQAAGFKIFYYHPLDDHTSAIWDILASMADLHVIHLKRRNILRTLVSRTLAGVENKWVDRAGKGSQEGRERSTAVSLSAEELREGFTETREWEQSPEYRFGNHPRITVDYEDMVNDPEQVFREVTEFLGVPFRRPKTELRKQNTRSLRETVANYDELKAKFAGTEWQPFFED